MLNRPFPEVIDASTLLSDDEIIEGLARPLRDLPYYAEAKLSIERIVLDDARLLVRSLIPSRLENAKQITAWYLNTKIAPFRSLFCKFDNLWSMLPPPVVEISDRPYILDGSHRSFAARSLGVTSIHVLAIRGCTFADQASDAHPWEQIGLIPDGSKWTERCTNLNLSLFRPVSQIFGILGRKEATLPNLLSSFQQRT